MIRAPRALALVFAVSLLCGCNVLPPATEDPTHFYVLSTQAPAAAMPQSGISVGIRAVGIPIYLTHREIVVRNGENEVLYKDFARWAEPVDAGVARIVQAKLQADSKVSHVYLPPFPMDAQRDYDVTISVVHCEGMRVASGAYVAQFAAVVELHKHNANEDVSVSRIVFTAPDKPWDGRDYGQLVGLLSSDCEELGAAIAQAIGS